MLYRGLDDAPVRRVDRNLASYVRPAPLDRSGFISGKRRLPSRGIYSHRTDP
jgi:hypothetical protein